MSNVKLNGRGVDKVALAARLPLRVRKAADVEALMVNSRAVRWLPAAGPEVEIPDLNSQQNCRLQRRIRTYIRSCGCAEGAIAALAGMFVVFGLVALQISELGPRWVDIGILVAGIFIAVLVGGVGKLLGVEVARMRFEHDCRGVIRALRSARDEFAGRTIK